MDLITSKKLHGYEYQLGEKIMVPGRGMHKVVAISKDEVQLARVRDTNIAYWICVLLTIGAIACGVFGIATIFYPHLFK